jgi:glutamate synthase (NADPH/NADH) small chain
MHQVMPVREPEERIKDFQEVALGFSEEQAIREAKRCLQCKEPKCISGCPVEIDIPAFIKLILEKKFDQAIKKIKEKNNLPAICGRVCPQEEQCEKVCILSEKAEPIAIGYLERFAADWELNRSQKSRDKKFGRDSVSAKVAVVGSGPAGLTCAADLAKMGHNVTIFESLHLPGGVLMYGIPEFRLPKRIVQSEVKYVQSLGVRLETNVLIGKTFTIDGLLKDRFKTIFIGSGAGLPQFLGIEGENLNRVYSANEFLTRVNLMGAYRFPEYDTPINVGKKVAVIGAGNVAFDAARVALRLGADEVAIVYRRTEAEMPARRDEIENAKKERAKIRLLTLPTKILGDKNRYVVGMECINMELGSPDESGRRRPIPIKNSKFTLEVDTVVVAIGQSPNPLIPQYTPGLKTDENGAIIVDKKTCQTFLRGVFAGGDITTGSDTVISAMGAGKRSARAIDRYIKEGRF